MTARQAEKYRLQLQAMADRVGGTAAGLQEQVRTPTSGESAGGLSNAPMHLGDVGSEVYAQELSTTLLENETHLLDEINDALERIDNKTYGACEGCGGTIPPERLEAVPYARHCVACAAALQAGKPVNFNDGRRQNWSEDYAPLEDGSDTDPLDRTADEAPFTNLGGGATRRGKTDTHAAGTPGGGSAVGGLAGTTVGNGDPTGAGLEDAMGSGNFDVAIDADDDPTAAYAGPSGGAVGGTPANKRAAGGKTRRGLAPQPDKGDSPTGQ